MPKMEFIQKGSPCMYCMYAYVIIRAVCIQAPSYLYDLLSSLSVRQRWLQVRTYSVLDCGWERWASWGESFVQKSHPGKDRIVHKSRMEMSAFAWNLKTRRWRKHQEKYFFFFTFLCISLLHHLYSYNIIVIIIIFIYGKFWR